MKTAVLMSACLFAIGLAAHAADDQSSPSSSARPDREAVHAQMEKCATAAGAAKGTRPTQEQHASIEACMKAAGFEKPPGPPGGHHGGRPPGPPPEDSGSSPDSAN